MKKSYFTLKKFLVYNPIITEGIFLKGACFSMVKIEHPLSKNMELVSTHDLNGQPGFQMALQVVDGHYYLYVTT